MSATALASLQQWDYYHSMREFVSRLAKGRSKKDKTADAQARGLSGMAQAALLVHLMNRTLANPRKKGTAPAGWAVLTKKELVEATGYSEVAINAAIADAVRRKLIEVIDQKAAKARGLKGGLAQAKWYRVCPGNWAAAPKYEPPAPKLVVMPDPEPEGSEPEGEPESQVAQVVKVAPGQPLILLPGQKSRPIPWSANAKKFSFDCRGLQAAVGGLKIERTFSFGVERFLISQQLADGTSEVDFRGSTLAPKVLVATGESPSIISDSKLLRAGLGDLGFEISAGLARELTVGLPQGCTPEIACLVVKERVQSRRSVKAPLTAALLPKFFKEDIPQKWKAFASSGGVKSGESDSARRARRMAELRGWIPEGGGRGA